MLQRMTYGSPARSCHSELYACLHELISPAEPIEAAANTYRVRAISDGHTRRSCLGCSAQVSCDTVCLYGEPHREECAARTLVLWYWNEGKWWYRVAQLVKALNARAWRNRKSQILNAFQKRPVAFLLSRPEPDGMCFQVLSIANFQLRTGHGLIVSTRLREGHPIDGHLSATLPYPLMPLGQRNLANINTGLLPGQW
jgi:hypothetical protein